MSAQMKTPAGGRGRAEMNGGHGIGKIDSCTATRPVQSLPKSKWPATFEHAVVIHPDHRGNPALMDALWSTLKRAAGVLLFVTENLDGNGGEFTPSPERVRDALDAIEGHLTQALMIADAMVHGTTLEK